MYDDTKGEMTTRLKIVQIITFKIVTFSLQLISQQTYMYDIVWHRFHLREHVVLQVAPFISFWQFTPFVVPISFLAH